MFIITNKVKIWTAALLLGVVFFVCPLTQVLAADEYINIASGQTVNSPGFYASNTIVIDGDVNGTVCAAAEIVNINGDIDGDLFVVGKNITLNGEVNGNIYMAGQEIRMNGKLHRDVFAAGESVYVDGSLERDAFLAGTNIVHSGNIGRKLYATTDKMLITGKIGDNARLDVSKLDIGDSATIDGGLVYDSPVKASIAHQAKIKKGVKWNITQEETPPEKPSFAKILISYILSVLGALLIWFIGCSIRPALWDDIAVQIRKEPLKCVGLGFASLIAVPVAAIVFMITMIGLPLGIISLALYGMAIYLSRIIISVLLARFLMERFSIRWLHGGVWLVLLSLAAIGLITRIPFVGFFFSLLIILSGLGAIILGIWPQLRKKNYFSENNEVLLSE